MSEVRGPEFAHSMAALRKREWRPYLLAAVMAAVVPIAVWVAAVVYEHGALLESGEASARRTVAALAKHMEKVLETHVLVLEQVDAQITGQSWPEIETDLNLRHTLNSVASKFPQIRSIWIVDEQGRRRQYGTSTGQVFQEEADVRDRDYFVQQKAGTPQRVYISRPFEGASGKRVFTVSVRRTSATGGFAGLVVVSVEVDYLTGIWKQFAPDVGHVIPLIRSDGVVMARYPAAEAPASLHPSGPFMRQIAAFPGAGFYTAVSMVDGIERLNAYRRIEPYPLYVSFSVERSAVLAPWRNRALAYGLGALVAMAALLGLVWSAFRHSLAMSESAAAWEKSARTLDIEIRRRERAEAELVQAQKMEAVGQLTGGIAHDFNNLLHVMNLNLQILARTLAPGQGQPHLQSIRRAVDRAAQLTRQLTAFSRRQRLEPRTISCTELLVHMGDLLARTLGGKIEVRIDAAPDVWTIFADPAQTEHAILNLAVNARDAMPDGGVLTLSARNHVAKEGDQAFVEISVADTGTGMPAEVMQRVFEPFFTTKEVGKGSGLGLSMVHGFVTQSGGSASLASQPGRGTTVTLLLPRGTGEAQPLSPQQRGSQPDHHRLGGRVLLVDDDSLVRAAMLIALQAAGYSVEEGADAKDALEILRRSPPDVLVTDYAMPGMTGAELARLSRTIAPALPIVLVTGYAQPGIAVQDVGEVDVVLHKPFPAEDLVQHLDRLLWKQSAQRA